jgi:predicted transcriptional regulator
MTRPNPTEGELAILRILWERKAPCTVHEVHEALSREKNTAYTTVLKILTIMSEKGLLRRDESERRHRYTPVHPEPEVQSALLKDLMQRAFSGSAVQLIQRALDTNSSSTEELETISRMIQQAKQRRNQNEEAGS